MNHSEHIEFKNNACQDESSVRSGRLLQTLTSGLLIYLWLVASPLWAQIDNNGCVGGNFGIDVGLYSGTIAYGDGSPSSGTNDWFLGSSGVGAIDESQTAAITSLLQAGGNPTYLARMNSGFTSIVNNQIRIDALFARDMFGGSGYTDYTAFENASKNGQDPADWDVGEAQVIGKSDLIDVAGFMFRDGQQLTTGTPSDLWFVGFINRAAPGGTAYMDFEFLVEDVQFNAAPVPSDQGEGNFTSGGPNLGHTAFQFDQTTGEIISLGDFIFNLSLDGGTTPNVEMRIWVSRTDYDNITPINGFSWGLEFDGAFNGASYGYASIIPTVNEICGIVNQAGETPQTPPWGSLGTSKNSYITSYEEYSAVELAVNLTAIGIDDATFPGSDPCDYPLNTFLVKSRASSSFTAALKDFSGPYEWTLPWNDAVNISANPLLACDNSTVQLSVSPLRSDATYTWTTTDGNIVSSPSSSTITVDEPGTYTVHTLLASGCPLGDSQITVATDSSKPLMNAPTALTSISCNGNDGTVDVTVTGGTAPYSYQWYDGANNAIATTEDLTGLAPGDYYVVVTDNVNCAITSDLFNVPARTPTVISANVTPAACLGSYNGAIDITVTGKSPFSFSWSTGATTEDITGLPSGSYTVTVTDADGCTQQASYTVNEPTGLTASTTVIHDSNPDTSVSNGSIDLSVSGGTMPYTYDWDYNGAENPDSDPQDLTGIPSGTYVVVVTDANGCTVSSSATVYEPEICNDGLDNDGDGLTDCDDPDCTVPVPGPITASVDPVCVGDTGIVYSVTDVGAETYTWAVPSGATITAGQGTPQITVSWTSNSGGDICVDTYSSGCQGASNSCFTVTLNNVPPTPGNITVNGN